MLVEDRGGPGRGVVAVHAADSLDHLRGVQVGRGQAKIYRPRPEPRQVHSNSRDAERLGGAIRHEPNSVGSCDRKWL